MMKSKLWSKTLRETTSKTATEFGDAHDDSYSNYQHLIPAGKASISPVCDMD